MSTTTYAGKAALASGNHERIPGTPTAKAGMEFGNEPGQAGSRRGGSLRYREGCASARGRWQ